MVGALGVERNSGVWDLVGSLIGIGSRQGRVVEVRRTLTRMSSCSAI